MESDNSTKINHYERTGFTETQIAKAIQEEASRYNANDIYRYMGISQATFFNFSRARYSIIKSMALDTVEHIAEV